MDLQSLLSSLQSTQRQKSSTRLSERNVVELVNKLKELGLLGDELLHTINGKEYITIGRLKQDVRTALSSAGGRVSLVDLPGLVGVELTHCEKAAATLVGESGGEVMEAQGELFTRSFFDAVAAEIVESLADAGAVRLGDLALSYGVSSELLKRMLGERLTGEGTQARMEGGVLFTPAYLRNIRAQLRGALRGATSPVNLLAVLRELGLEGGIMGAGGAGAIIEELVTGHEVAGSFKASGGMWLPHIYGKAQENAIGSEYAQNGWIDYDTLKRMGITDPQTVVRTKLSGAIPLVSGAASPALLAQVDALVEEVIVTAGWGDVTTVLPSGMETADAAALLMKSELVKDISKVSLPQAGTLPPRTAIQLAETAVVSADLLAQLAAAAAAFARTEAEEAVRQRLSGTAASTPAAAGNVPASKSARARPAGGQAGVSGRDNSDSEDDESWDVNPKKGAKGRKGGAQGRGRGGKNKGGKSTIAAAGSSSSGSTRTVGFTTSKLAAALMSWHSDMEGVGAGDGGLLGALASVLMAAALPEYEAALAAAALLGADGRKRAAEVAARTFDDTFQRFVVLCAGADTFAEDEATHTALVRHLGKTTGSEALDSLYRYAALRLIDDGEDVEVGSSQAPLTAAERAALSKRLPRDVSKVLATAGDSLAHGTTQDMIGALETAGSEVGCKPRQPDKKASKALVAQHAAHCEATLAAATAPATAAASVVPLLAARTRGVAVSVPGKALAGVLKVLEPHLDPQVLAEVKEFQERVVTFLRQSSSIVNAPGRESVHPCADMEADMQSRMEHLRVLVLENACSALAANT